LTSAARIFFNFENRRCKMSKYLFQCSYTAEGLMELLNDGGSKRREGTEQLMRRLGGTLETYYFAFGGADVIIVVDLPDNVTAAAASLLGNTGRAIKVKTTVLITPEEVDQAAQKTIDYRSSDQ
jgi:uncharacterized protein with GYD domain